MDLRGTHNHVDANRPQAPWCTVTIKNVASITTGKRNTQDRFEDGTYPFFVRSQVVERINSYSFDGEAVLTAGDGVGTGKVFHYINGKFDFHQRVYKISDFSPDMDGFFFYLYFSTHFYDRIMSMTAKSSVDSVRMEMIADMIIPCPPIAEQRAIASTIRDVNSLLAAFDNLIVKKREIKHGAKERLLTAKVRLPGWKGEWKARRLAELGSFLKGRGVTKDESLSGTLPCVRYGEIYTRHSDYIRTFYSWISPEIAAMATRLRRGDILFAGSGETKEEIGKCVAFVDDMEAYAGGDIVILRPDSADPRFLGYYLNTSSINRQKASRGQGDAVVHISSNALSEIQGRFPTLPEQSAVAAVLSDMDDELGAIEAQSAKLHALKQGMLQELLSGRVRLV